MVVAPFHLQFLSKSRILYVFTFIAIKKEYKQAKPTKKSAFEKKVKFFLQL
jgi:hypothetical protein